MRILNVYERFSRTFRDNPSLSRLLIVCTVSGGGLVAYSEATADNGVKVVDSPVTGNQRKKVVVIGTGWAGTSFLKSLKNSSYDVQVISPRNYFAFTPLLPSVTVGTVEARSIVEPIRNIVKKKNFGIHYWEAECFKIDAANKKVYCRSSPDNNLSGKEEFTVDYDYLVVAMGARSNTFNTPGVEENCHFLKSIERGGSLYVSLIGKYEALVPKCYHNLAQHLHDEMGFLLKYNTDGTLRCNICYGIDSDV